ncbi:MAG: 30S ribosomal protein S9 [Bacilli bacterium]|jgi:small subunit ribosomal protein S9|nr:30S ribosomal protein S9 [Mollicutes bacterium]
MVDKKIYTGTGHRKTSIAKVRMTLGKGNIIVNGKDVSEYMPFPTLVMDLKQPLVVVGMENKFDIEVDTFGGGFSGQTGAIRLGITKALLEFDEPNKDKDDSYRKQLKVHGFITRDPRKKERKKYGLKKARKAPQFSKR